MKHRTAKGREFNMSAFATDRGATVAVGNSGRNARGDLLGSGGKIIATSQQITNRAHNSAAIQQKQVKLNPLEQEVGRNEVIGADGVVRWEVTYADGSVEMIIKEEQPVKAKKASATKQVDSTVDSTIDFSIDNFLNSEE